MALVRGDHVHGRGVVTADEVAAAGHDDDAVASVAQRGGAGRVGTYIVAPDAVARDAGTGDDEAIGHVRGDDVPLAREETADLIPRRADENPLTVSPGAAGRIQAEPVGR